jgi:hypothetical protein
MSASTKSIIVAIGVIVLSASIGWAQSQPAEGKPTTAPVTQPAEADFTPEGVLSGRITDEKGSPVTDAHLQLSNDRANEYHTGKTDEDGLYSFKEVKAVGTFALLIRSRGWVGTRKWEDRPTIDLRPGTQTVRHFKLQRACQVEIQVSDETGNSIQGARLTISSLETEYSGNMLEDSRTDSDGLGVVGGMPPSPKVWLVTVWHNDYAYGRVNITLNDADKVPKREVILKEGASVRGQAICSDGKPGTGWSINALPDWWHSNYLPMGAKIDDQGNFTLNHIVPGTYALSYSVPQGDHGSTSHGLNSVKLPPEGDLLEVKIPQPSPSSLVEISGTVTFKGGAPKGSFEVTAQSNDDQYHSVYMREGEREFKLASLMPGVYELRFRSNEFEDKVIPDVKAPTADLKVEIEVTGRPVLECQAVEAATGKPIEHFKARLRKLSTLRGANYMPDAQWQLFDGPTGGFDMETVGPGVYEVQVAAQGFAWATSAKVNTDEDKGKTVRVELKPGVTLTGKVVNEAGQPVSGARVMPLSHAANDRGRSQPRSTQEQEGLLTTDGKFTLEHLAAGSEGLKVTHPDYCFTRVEHIELKEGAAPPDVTVTLRTGGTVAGRLLDENGKPAANVALSFRSDYAYPAFADESEFALVTTDAEGRYQVQHLPEQLCYILRKGQYSAPGIARYAIVPRNGQTSTLEMGSGPVITGRLVIDGQPCANRTVQIGGESPHFNVFQVFAVTDKDGAFKFRGTPRGRRTLYFGTTNQRVEWIPVKTFEATEADMDLGTVSPELGEVSVVVKGEAGAEPPAGVMFTLSKEKPGHLEGEYMNLQAIRSPGPGKPAAFEHIAPGAYIVTTYKEGHPNVQARVELKPGQKTAAIELVFPVGTAILEGKTATDVKYNRRVGPMLWNRARGVVVQPYGREEGRYRAERLPAGKYELVNNFDLNEPPFAEITLQDGETKSLNIDAKLLRLDPNSTAELGYLQLILVTAKGIPLPGGEVYLTRPGGRVTPERDSDLSLHFIAAAGEYTLHASYPGVGTATRPVKLQAASDNRTSARSPLVVTLEP